MIDGAALKTSNIAIGVALVLSATALVLALWLVISGTPVEQEPNALKQELSQGAVCLRLTDALANTTIGQSGRVQRIDILFRLSQAWDKAGCSDYFAGFAK